MVRIILLATVFFAGISRVELNAQACCSGGTPLSGTLGLEYVSSKTVLLEFNYDYNTQQSLVSGSEALSDNFRTRNTHSILGRLGYAFDERWMIIGLWSVIRQEEITDRIGGGQGLKRAEGLGDAVVFGQYTLLNNTTNALLLGAGVEIPLGATDKTDDLTGLPLHPDLQPGRGAWALLGGLRFSQSGVIRPSTTLGVNLTYRLTTPADRYEGLQTYEFGNEFRLLTGLSDQFLVKTVLLEPSLSILYRNTQVDEVNGFDAPNTSGHWLHLRPGIHWLVSPEIQIGGFAEFPVWWNLEGTQLTTTTRVRVRVQYAIASD